MTIKEKVETNVVIWLLGVLLAGFFAGIGTYKGIIEIANLKVVKEESTVKEIDVKSLYRGSFNLGNAYTWASSKELNAAKSNYKWAYDALVASKLFKDLSLARSVMNEVSLNSIKDPDVLKEKILNVHENLSGQAASFK